MQIFRVYFDFQVMGFSPVLEEAAQDQVVEDLQAESPSTPPTSSSTRAGTRCLEGRPPLTPMLEGEGQFTCRTSGEKSSIIAQDANSTIEIILNNMLDI